MTCITLMYIFSFRAAARQEGCAFCRRSHNYVMATKFY